MNSKVSIVIPIYNSEVKLKDCLESIRNQTYKNFEVILINDGSTDCSGNICDYYSEIDDRFIVQHCENRGVSAARNKGINLANGKYLVFIDSDDKIKNNMLESMVSYIEKADTDVLISGITFIGNKNVSKELLPNINGKIGIDIWKYICEDTSGLYGYVPNKMYRLKVIKDNEIYFDENRQIQEDLDFAINVYSKCNKFYLLQESYYLYEYEDKHRVPDSLGYMEIELKKREIYKQKDIYMKFKDFHCNKLSNMIFTYIYYTPLNRDIFFKAVKKLYELNDIKESLDVFRIRNIEQKYIAILINNRLLSLVRMHFILRRYINSVIRRVKLFI